MPTSYPTTLPGQVIVHEHYNGDGFTNENSLANAFLTKPDQITPVVTHLFGRESDRFPLTFMTEGQVGGIKRIEINDVQYTYDVMGRMKHGSKIVSTTYVSGDFPGINHTPFYITFEDNWHKVQHTVVSPSGIQARIMERPTMVGSHWVYRLQLHGYDPTAYVPVTELVAGTEWVMSGGANVSESFSHGNESNTQTPGKLRNQIGFLRKSYRWGGNAQNKVVEVQLPTDNGGSTSYWMQFEEYLHYLNWKEACEEYQWYSLYNRKADGTIPLIDPDTNLPIPIGAGLDQQIPNRDTYSFLTYRKIKNTIGDIFSTATDTGKMTIALYTGTGGAEEFDNAMKGEMVNYTQITGDKFIKEAGSQSPGGLMLGGYFTMYRHIDGHEIIVKRLGLLDRGSRATNAPKHPITGKPMTSYDMYFVDQSVYDGMPNLQSVCQVGRQFRRGVVRGMAPMSRMEGISSSEGAFSKLTANDMIATDKDECSVHFMASKGILLRRNTQSFKLTCSLS